MNATSINRGTLLYGSVVRNVRQYIELGKPMLEFTLANGLVVTARRNGSVPLTAGPIDLAAAWVKVPTRTEIKAAVKERQGGDYVGVVTTRRV